MRWLGALIALTCAVRVAHAGDVGVVTTGEPSLQPAVVKHFEKWLRKHGHNVIDSPLSVDAINTLANCFTLDDLACARGVFDARAKTPTLVYVGISLNGKNVTFNVYWFDKGKEAVGERRVCEKCEGNGWHGLTDKMLERLAGETTVVYVDKGERHGSRLWPSLVMGAGIATLAAGGIFFYYGSLDGSDQKYIYPDSTPVGIALAAVGAGAAIGGTIWLVQTGGTSRTGPVATATPGGAYVGWVGHF
jgi:hypothetical protein